MKAGSLNCRLFRKPRFPKALYLCLAALFLFIATVSTKATPGAIDITFGIGGRVFSPFEQTSQSHVVLIQPDGKIIVGGGGFGNSGPRDFALVRYLPDGSIDTSFGNSGIVLTDMRASEFGGSPDWVTDAELLPDAKIVVVGRAAYNYGAPFDGSLFGIARYFPDGTLDASFSLDGREFFPGGLHDVPTGIEVQADGKLLVAGTRGRCPDCINPEQFVIVRFNTDGTIDPSFDGDGSVIGRFTPKGDSSGDALALQPDGKIIIAGKANFDFAIARYNSDGKLDTNFGNSGMILITDTVFERGTNIITEPDGKIVVLGSDITGNESDFIVLRFDPDGTPDNTFGVNGRVVTDLTGLADVPHDAVHRPDGKLIVAGISSNSSTGGDIKAALVRYNIDGSLDQTFGIGGIVLTPNYSIVRAALQTDDKIVTINDRFNIIRYHGDTPFLRPRRTFDFTGDGLTDFAVARDVAGHLYWNAARNPDLDPILDIEFGIASDRIVPADYDSDEKIDVAVFRDGNWFILRSADSSFASMHFGTAGDIPVPADYTGDGQADLAVYRDGLWYTLDLANDQFQAVPFGLSTDRPVPEDYDGDGKTDLAVYRDGVWYMLCSKTGFRVVEFGIASDIPVVGDYDGDLIADQAVFRAGTWYVLGSTQGFYTMQFGLASDTPVAADYDGDGKTDIAVFRDGIWHLLRSKRGYEAVLFGTASDRPIPAAFLP